MGAGIIQIRAVARAKTSAVVSVANATIKAVTIATPERIARAKRAIVSAAKSESKAETWIKTGIEREKWRETDRASRDDWNMSNSRTRG